MSRLESIEDAPAAIGEIKSEIERVVSHLEQFEPKLLHDYIPIFISKCRFEMPLPGGRVLRVHLHQLVENGWHGKTNQSSTIERFWMYKNRHLHTYFGLLISLPDALPRLKSPEGAPAPAINGGKKSRSEQMSQSWSFGLVWTNEITFLHTYNWLQILLPSRNFSS